MDASAPRFIEVTGIGRVVVEPDEATVILTISILASPRKKSQEEHSKKVADCLEKIRALGIEDKAVWTANYHTSKETEYDSGKEKNIPKGFRTSQTLTIKTDLEKAGDLFETVNSFGESNGPNFACKNADALQEQACELAIIDGLRKARSRAKLLRLRDGAVLGCYETPQAGRHDRGSTRMMSASAPAREYAPEIPAGRSEFVAHMTLHVELHLL